MIRRAEALLLLLVFLAVIAVASAVAILPADLQIHAFDVALGRVPPTLDRTPGELIRHARQRLEGHPKLEFFALPVLDLIQPFYERPVMGQDFHTFGKGQQDQPSTTGPVDFSVSTIEGLTDAMSHAKAGQTIELVAGRYRLHQLLSPRHGGAADAPITLRAARTGSVILEVACNEGFLIAQPYWVFENLNLQGVCESDDSCEHAFHVVGGGHHITLRNNWMENFSAHIKVNGAQDQWPDDGLIQHNTLHNTRTRNTDRPVTPIDIVGASRFQIADNVVSNFSKSDPRWTTFGIFMKGAGFGGRIERNVVICSTQAISQPGTRVGISFGGGETGKSYCRDHECSVEFEGGRAVNNIVAHCNDMGIDVNRSQSTFVAHNTLINTAGIDVRGEGSSALLYGNHLEGVTRSRKGGILRAEFNEVGNMLSHSTAADRLQLNQLSLLGSIPQHKHVLSDICQQPRKEGTLPGALEAASGC